MKLKTSKSARKRIKNFTSRGKIIRVKMSAQHLRAGKSKRTERSANKSRIVHKTDERKIKKMIPYK